MKTSTLLQDLTVRRRSRLLVYWTSSKEDFQKQSFCSLDFRLELIHYYFVRWVEQNTWQIHKSVEVVAINEKAIRFLFLTIIDYFI
jgi:hypothetical protein